MWIEIIRTYVDGELDTVAPFAGVWIEITLYGPLVRLRRVAPFAGVWIEIKDYRLSRIPGYRRTLRGCVD